jgi:predicted nucleic acid-binding protein
VKLIFDASSLFNLAHGGVLPLVLALPESAAILGPQVYGECGSIRGELDDLIQSGALELADDQALPATIYFDVLERFGLGAGETECIAFAKHDTTIDAVCCDDRRARSACERELGRQRLTGTLRRLAVAVSASELTSADAYGAYQRMLTAGAFLPTITVEQFDQLVAGAS